jgi:hypothetical protein
VSDFILEGETDDTSEEEENTSHATTPAADVTRVCMENSSLNTGANCKRYVCTILPESSSCIKRISKFTGKYSPSYRLGDKEKKKRKDQKPFYFIPKLCKFRFLHLILSVSFFSTYL